VAWTDVSALNRKEGAGFRGRTIGFIFQDFNLLPVLTVYENIEYPLLMVQDVPARNGASGSWPCWTPWA
jgi:putative ABC transport system ATP-binding protein